jgi:hypothetical protein
MGVLLITCPLMGKKFSTGIQIEWEDFEQIDSNTVMISHCPYCKRDHEWCYRNAQWMPALPPEDWIENQ